MLVDYGVDMAKNDLKQLFENAGISLPNENSLGEKIIPDDDHVKLKNFWNWFGNSKVVDEQGRPLVVYHKSPNKDIIAFKPNLAKGWGKGVYFSDNLSSLDEFGDNVYVVYLKIEKPFNNDYSALEKTKAYQKAVKKYLDNDYEDYVENEYDFPSAYDIFENDQTYFTDSIYECGFDGIISENSNNIEGLELIVFKPNQIKTVNNTGTFSSASNNIYEATAYHGSPTKFDEFSLKYISTGEGYQVHGWGIYFTLDKEVARGYKYRLGKKKERQLENWENKILEDIRNYGFDEVVKNIKYSLEKCKKINHTDGIKRYQTSLDFIDSLSVVDGMILTVDIPNDEELLVEDDLLKNQPSKVKNIIINYIEELYGEQLDADKIDDYLDQIKDFIRKANIPDEQKEESDMLISYLFRSHLSDYKQNPDELFRTWNNEIIRQIDIIKLDFEDLKKANYFKEKGNENYKNKIIAHNFIRNNLKNIIDMMTKNGELDLYGININYIMNNVKGKKFYKQLSDYFISKSNTKRNRGDCLASMWLLKQGVQGIKYHGGLDGDCVVIFNPKRVKIIGKE